MSHPPLRPASPAMLHKYGPEIGRMVHAIEQHALLPCCLIVGVRSAQFRLRTLPGIEWEFSVHSVADGSHELLYAGGGDRTQRTLACPGAWRERERLRRHPHGLPCWVSPGDAIAVVGVPGESCVLFDSGQVLEDGVVEMSTREGSKFRAYRIVERPRPTLPGVVEPDPQRLVLRPSDLPPVPDPLVSRYLAAELQAADAFRRTWALEPATGPADEPLAWPFPRDLHVLTAWNPLGVPLSAAENRRRQGRLVTRLARRGARMFGALATEPEAGRDAWVEESLLVADLLREEAVDLGRAFHQHALFELRGSTLRLVGCRDARVLGERVVRAVLRS